MLICSDCYANAETELDFDGCEFCGGKLIDSRVQYERDMRAMDRIEADWDRYYIQQGALTKRQAS